MIFINQTTSIMADCYVCESTASTASIGVERKWREEVLPHYYAPSSRQPALDPPSVLAAMSTDEDVELDSPPFTPPELNDFAARGFARRNRWGASGPKR